MVRFYILFFILLLLISSCKNKTDIHQVDTEALMNQFSEQGIQDLCNKKIFFGHMSVGYNIINGLNDLKKDDKRLSDFSIVEIEENNEIQEPGLYHKKNGKNGFPETKCDAFKNFLLEDSLGKQFDIALFKFCYVDLVENSNLKLIFEKYIQTIDEVKKMFPDLKIVHVTTPLHAHNFSIKNRIKIILKGDLANIKRNEFNRLIIEKYSGLDPIFNLAKIESTYPDQHEEYFTHKGVKYNSLIKEYTYDGGHLNKLGRKWVAAEFLRVLISE